MKYATPTARSPPQLTGRRTNSALNDVTARYVDTNRWFTTGKLCLSTSYLWINGLLMYKLKFHKLLFWHCSRFVPLMQARFNIYDVFILCWFLYNLLRLLYGVKWGWKLSFNTNWQVQHVRFTWQSFNPPSPREVKSDRASWGDPTLFWLLLMNTKYMQAELIQAGPENKY